MEEARRFIRYVLPGVVFAIQFGVVFSLLRPDLAGTAINEIKKDSGISLILAGVLATGGLGALFSAIHHAWHWRSRGKTMDHRSAINELIGKGILVIGDAGQKVESRENAWIIVTALWHTRRETNVLIRGADVAVNQLVDLMHAIGAMRVAGIVGALLAFAVATTHSSFSLGEWPVVRFAFAILIGLSVFWVLHLNYCRVAHFTRVLVERILVDALNRENPPQLPVIKWPSLPKQSRGSV